MKPTKIRLLSPSVVHRIAAGEVVENPAAAMKELVENSIDAGSTQVSVMIVGGGLTLIEVKDNGAGMSQSDLEACCQRHATSKIHELVDLDQIFSLGFRGEALAALSSVSHLEISSQEKGSAEAWILKRQGATFSTAPTPELSGTTVRIKDLFFNTPARKKFLKSLSSEASRCVKVFRDLAAAHPAVQLSLHVLSDTSELEEDLFFPAQSRLERVATLLSKESESFLHTEESSVVSGLKKIEIILMRPPNFIRSSKDIFFVVNGRPVEDKKLPYVLRESFGGLIEVGTFPRGVVYIDVDATQVDVNVHPQKKELRWAKEFPLYSLIYEQSKRSLAQTLKNLSAQSLETSEDLFSPTNVIPLNQNFSSASVQGDGELQSALYFIKDYSKPTVVEPIFKFSELRVVGEVGAAWLVCESPQGMIVIDQHAAHERVRFDEILHGSELFSATPLLIPLSVSLPLSLKGRAEDFLASLELWAFEGRILDDVRVEFFAVPKTPRKIEWKSVFDEVFRRLDEKESVESLKEVLKVWMASSVACHGSVRRGQRLTNPEIMELLKSMDQVHWKEFCPHGRPTWIEFSHTKLEEEFHRI